MTPFLNTTDKGGVTADTSLSNPSNETVPTEHITFDTHQRLPSVNGTTPHHLPLSARGIQVMVHFVISVQVRNRLFIVRVVIVIDILFGSAATEFRMAPNASDSGIMLVWFGGWRLLRPIELWGGRRFVRCGQRCKEPLVLFDPVRVERTVLDRPHMLGQLPAEPRNPARVRSNRSRPPSTNFQLLPACIAVPLAIVEFYPLVVVVRATRSNVVIRPG